MKRAYIIAILFLMCLTSFCITAYAETGGYLNFETAEDAAGNYIVTLVLDGKDNIEMMQFAVKYDADKLQMNSCSIGDGFEGTMAPTVNAQDGEVFLVWDALEPFRGGNLLVFSFSAKDGASGTASVGINRDEEFVFADNNFEESPITDTALEITVGKEEVPTEPEPEAKTEEKPETKAETESETKTEEKAKTETKTETTTTTKTEGKTETKTIGSNSINQGQNNGIELNSYSVDLKPGESYDVSKEHTDGVLWTSGNEAVATVKDGVVTAVGKGITVITAESEDGDVYSTCVVRTDIQPEEESPETAKLPRYIPALAAVIIIVVLCTVIFIKKKGRNS